MVGAGWKCCSVKQLSNLAGSIFSHYCSGPSNPPTSIATWQGSKVKAVAAGRRQFCSLTPPPMILLLSWPTHCSAQSAEIKNHHSDGYTQPLSSKEGNGNPSNHTQTHTPWWIFTLETCPPHWASSRSQNPSQRLCWQISATFPLVTSQLCVRSPGVVPGACLRCQEGWHPP